MKWRYETSFKCLFQETNVIKALPVELLCPLGWFQKKIHHHKGQMKEFCPLISDLLLFFSWHLWLISHFRSKFSKTKGGTLGWKKSEKNRFLCLIPQKNRLEKCRLKVKLVFRNIDFCGSYGSKTTEKCSKLS